MEKRYCLIGAIIAGSLWGLLEATLGGFLHLIHLPRTGAIMTALGYSIISFGMSTFKPKNLSGFVLAAGVTAAAMKGADILWFGPQRFVINPMVAIVLESLVLGVVVYGLGRYFEKAKVTIPLAGVLSAGGWVLAFALLFQRAQLGRFILETAPCSALFAAVGVTAGYLAGKYLHSPTAGLVQVRQKAFYALSSVVIVASWVIGVAASVGVH